MEQEKIFENDATDKGLISKIHRQLIQLNPILKIGRRCKQMFLQERHTDSQRVHAKMLIIANYQRNANQNYSEVSSQTNRNGHLQKSTNKCWSGYGEKKGTFLHCWWEWKLVCLIWRTVWVFLKNLKTELACDPEIALLGIHLKKILI